MNFDKQRGGQKKCNWLQARGVSVFRSRIVSAFDEISYRFREG